MVAPKRPPSLTRAPGSVRIIGGRLRGSRLPVADGPGLRPTSDRVRETVFNWLQGRLQGASVVDLFAGSGALGFEAASRGAARVVLVESSPALAASLRESADRLKADAVEVRCADALGSAALREGERFDGAFVDPPFAAGLEAEAVRQLMPRLTESAWLYLESPSDSVPALPGDWRLLREGRTREVRYALYLRTAPG